MLSINMEVNRKQLKESKTEVKVGSRRNLSSVLIYMPCVIGFNLIIITIKHQR
jgi:hypothetical protein